MSGRLAQVLVYGDEVSYAHDQELFAGASACFVDVVTGIDQEDWDRPALGEWNVRELVAHTLRAFSTIDNFLDHPLEQVGLNSAGEYYAALMSRPGLDVEVAQRARDAAQALGPDPLEAVVAQVDSTLRRLRVAEGAEIGLTAGGGMRLRDYLQTRLVELVVHHGDLCVALGVPTGNIGEAESQVLVTVLSAASPANRNRVLRAVLGRDELPSGFMIWL